jgi:4-amino-4-deoxy-L-arabinose transferase-like glycosyltransferase
MGLNPPSTRPTSRIPWFIWLILALHLALGVLYSVVTPAWEAVDEPGHYQYVEYVALQRALPPAGDALLPRVGGSSGTQPPLYYLLAAIPVIFVQPPAQDDFRLNRYAGSGSAEFGVNMVVHDFAAEAFPWSGQLLALHLARLVSVILSTVGVFYVYLLARWVFVGRPALTATATAIAAFLPQYLFIGGAVTNDILIAVLACAALYYAARVALEPARVGDLIGLGVSLGLALVTKNTAVGLIPSAIIAALAAGVRELRAGQTRRLLVGILAVATIILALAGWWFGRNLSAYGALLSRDQDTVSRLMAGLRQPADFFAGLSWSSMPDALWYGFQTFWGTFGWANVGMPAVIYQIIAVVCVAALWSCLLRLVWPLPDRRLLRSILFLGFSAGVLTLAPFGREVVRGLPTLSGRFLFPTLPAVSILLTIGLLWWAPRLAQKALAAFLCAVLLVCAIIVPFVVIEPAYARPPAPTSQELPAGAEPLDIRFGDRAELYGYRIWPNVVPQGKAVSVTLYFKALRQNVENYAIAVYVFGPGGQPYGQTIRFPARGNFATSLWQPGDLIEDTFWVPIGTDRPAPALGTLGVSMMLDAETPVRLGARDANDRPLGEAAMFGRLKIAAPQTTPTPVGPAVAIFGGRIGVTEVHWPAEPIRLGDVITVTARLQARQDLDRDYVLFIHLLNLANNRLAGMDAVPRAGEYPPGLWDKGEGSLETRSVKVPTTIPPGKYLLSMGMYQADTKERLSVAIGETGVPSGTLWYSPPFIISK